MRRLLFSIWYWLRRPPWDTGITPPELVRFVSAHSPGRALDLGCGTGTNVVYLAKHAWDAVGVDFAGRAIAKARDRARRAGVRAAFHVADVTRLGFLSGPFDLALDIGCLHSLPPADRPAYAGELERLVRHGGTYLLYTFAPDGPAYGLTREDVSATFGRSFDLAGAGMGTGPRGRPSAWYTLTRR